MILFRRDPMRVLEKVAHRIKVAEMKLLVADNIRRERRRRPINELVMVSAMTGIPVLPEFLENTYVNAAISNFRKALRDLEGVLRLLDTGAYRYSSGCTLARLAIEDAASMIRKILEGGAADTQAVVSKAREAYARVIEAIEVLRTHPPS